MTREEARVILEDGGYLSYHAWIFFKHGMSCWDEYNCCQDDWNNVEEALDRIESYCGGKWDEVKDAT